MDTPIPPTQQYPSKKHLKSISIILSDEDEACVVEWLVDHPLMYNKTLKEYKETDKKRSCGRNLDRSWGLQVGTN